MHLIYTCACAATAIISPSETAPACIGGQLGLTCNVMGNFLEWSINISSTGDEPYSRTFSRYTETMGFQINTTQFTFSRVSPQGSSPLVSVLLIGPISRYLNGTVVNCTDGTGGEISSTIIKIITDLRKSYITINFVAIMFAPTLISDLLRTIAS